MKVIVTSILYFLAVVCLGEDDCCRLRSRIASRFLNNKMLPLYHDAELSIPRQCPFHPENNKYGQQEEYKYEENPSRWNCEVCGKAFYDERFLDLHFENRHKNYLRSGKKIVCLADYCDIVRCEVIAGHRKPQFWDVALCKEHELQQRRLKCTQIISKCIPEELTGTNRRKFTETLNETVCRYLTCANYWEPPDPEGNPLYMATYGMMCVFVAFGISMYYYIAYTHFFTVESLWDPNRDSQRDSFPDCHMETSLRLNEGMHHFKQRHFHGMQQR